MASQTKEPRTIPTKNDKPNSCYEESYPNIQNIASTVVVKTEPNQEGRSFETSPSNKTSSELQVEGIQTVSIHKNPNAYPFETQETITPNEFDRRFTEAAENSESLQTNQRKGEETVDVTTVEDDTHTVGDNAKEWKANETVLLKRSHTEIKEKEHKEQDINPKKSILEKDHSRYHNSLTVHPKENLELPLYNKLRGVLPEYAPTNFYPLPADSYKPYVMYMHADGVNNQEAALRRAYYEEMMQRELHSQFRSAFKKPEEERAIQEMKFLGPAVRFGLNQMVPYLPFYNHRLTRDGIMSKNANAMKPEFQSNPNHDTFNRGSAENYFKQEGEKRDQKIEVPDEYRMYGPNKYIALNPGVPYPYLPYRAPMYGLDKVHQEAQCMYPCCTGAEKIPLTNSERHVGLTKLSPYIVSPVHAQAFSQTVKPQTEDKEQRSNQSNDPNEMAPSFKEFLEAERQRLAADPNLAQESQNKSDSDMEKNSKSSPTWQYNNKESETVKQRQEKIPSKLVDDIVNVNSSQTIHDEQNEKANFQTQETDALTEETSIQDNSVPPVKKIACSVCNKTFNRTSNLYTHMRTHSTHKPHVCEFCGKRFHQKADLRIHRYIHTGEKPHKCTKCGRGFKQLTHLKYHMRTHSDVRMYKCPYCEKGFNQKSNLQAHIFGHTGQRPHKCDVCGKGFTLASTLNTHKRTHLPTKPFQCQFCERAFYQKNALKMHYVSTHPYSSGAV